MGNQLSGGGPDDTPRERLTTHQHPLAPKRSTGLWLLSRTDWTCDGCGRRSFLHPSMKRYTCTVGCHFDLCGRCFTKEVVDAEKPEVVDAEVIELLNRACSSGRLNSNSRIPEQEELFKTLSTNRMDVLRRAEETSTEEAECAICYDDLCNGPIGVLCVPGVGRSCRHFFHAACLHRFTQSGISAICPLCRTPFAEVQKVPPPMEDPEGWFRAMDTNLTGRLSREEVGEALRAVFPVCSESLRRHFDVLWAAWDKTGSGDITMEEFLNQDGGLLSWVIATSKEVKKRAVEPPDLSLDREGWFRYWDVQGCGALDKEQIMRAFLKTFRDADVIQLRAAVGGLWEDFSDSGSIRFEEFVRPMDGFLDKIMASIAVDGEAVPTPQQHSSDAYTVGARCSCGKVHVHRGDRVQRARWPAGQEEDGGAGELGSIIFQEEGAGLVQVRWDLAQPQDRVDGYAWPADPTGHEVVHVRPSHISSQVLQLQEQTGLSSAAAMGLLQLAAEQLQLADAGQPTDIVSRLPVAVALFETGIHQERSLRRPVRLFDRCRVLPERALVKQWFEASPPCPCSNPACTGGVRWNNNAEKHLGREGYVLKIDERDNSVLVEVFGRCNCKVWYPRTAVDPVFDPDVAQAPRFAVGDRVECKMSSDPDVWVAGQVNRIWWRQPEFGNRPTAPYQVHLEDGRTISAPRDTDDIVRRA